ncbi:ATP-binding cassette domain-containing protein [Phaeobacter gallaeciensis]|nr:ATP-binding cassette domain-containing protein [Phaeobacter gallaeciensis]
MSNSNRPTDDTVLRTVPPAPRAPDDAARGSGGKPVLRAVETQAAPHLAPASAAPTPTPGPAAPPMAEVDLTGLLEDGDIGEVSALIEDATARIQHRAALIATFAALKGTNVALSDVAEHMWRNDPGDVSVDSLARALQTTGMQAQINHQVPLTAESWPALAMMNNGQCVLVLSQSRDMLSVYDTTCTDNRADVPVGEFGPYFTGTTLGARNSLKQIAARHTPQLESDHWFWGEFPKYRRQVGEIMLGSLVANILAVSVALFSLQVYDRVVPHQSHATLWVLAVGAFLAIMLEALLKLARARLTDAAGRQIELSVQNNLMRRLIGMRSDKKPLPPSGLFAAMRDFGSVREFFTSTTISTLADIPFIAVFLLLVASIAGPIVWIIIAGGILMLLPAYFMQKRMIALTRQTQGANAKAGRLLHEVVNELDTLKSQRGEDRVLRLWDELNTLSTHAATEQRRLSSALTHWSQGVQQATYIGSVVVGTLMVFAGEFTVGTIIATGILTSRTLAPLTQFAATLARWSNVKGALEGLDAIANSAQEKEDERSYLRRDSLQGRFELREVMFRYDEDGAPTLDVPGVAVTPGQRVAVLGVNGSGKSTLLKLMSGLYAPDRGRVMIDGTDMTQIDPRDLRRHIGYLSQDVRLFAGTLRENLNLNQLERDDDRLMTALDFAGLGAHVRNHHKGLDLEIFDGGGGLSIGQRQSIGWARLWLQNPSIVLLDEPTAALDQTLERTLVSRLETWLEGRTTVIATHRMPILSLTNRTLILQSGRMVVDGPRDQVLAHLAAGEAK